MNKRKRTSFGRWLSKMKGERTKASFQRELGFCMHTLDGWLYRGVRPRLVNAMEIVQRLEKSRGLCSKALWDELYEVMYVEEISSNAWSK